ncbi:hypothetical protein EUGRSUZ_H02885 [Eucalyptus grandis]|uniref:C-terminal processing peptidase n=2 Tax=Eucalyptus grandis TaxID=71139 RepID=A0A059B2N0_EUCGR|nr:hypothetical protein EUGRSUZ_H02885 [Eucalyptus grandis]
MDPDSTEPGSKLIRSNVKTNDRKRAANWTSKAMEILATSTSSLSTLRPRFVPSGAARPRAIPTAAIVALKLAPPQPRAATSLGARIACATFLSKGAGAGGRGREFWRTQVWRLDGRLSLDGLKRRVSKLLVGVMLVMSFSLAVSNTPSWALSEENLLFLEAWRTLDRAYIDKNFNGQSWFRYRENALRNEPMNTREETYTAIRKMIATLDDPFTRFLEPEKFRSLRSGTQGALTGVGLSIGYPARIDNSPAGLVVISAAPGGPAKRAGILSGDVLLAIDNSSTETMGIYDAAEKLQGPEGSTVELTLQSGNEIKHLALTREKVSLNPVKSRLCEVPGSGKDSPRIGYIKLTSFTQNASGAVKEAIETLRSNHVNAFILDLRDNSGGLFPEGVEIAKLWLDKGVIVYICDSRGVRDIYDTDGGKAMAASEPLAVLVNKGTASASEILAGALKDNKRAVLFGEPTFGKGKIQSVFQLSDGSGLAVTVARYETPAHNDIDKVSLPPSLPPTHPLPLPVG